MHDAITSNTYQSAPSGHAGNAGSEGSWERKVMATQRKACTSHEGKGNLTKMASANAMTAVQISLVSPMIALTKDRQCPRVTNAW